MPDPLEPQEGHFYWAITARSNLAKEFGDKEFRPVLVVKRIGFYAAIYPCSTTFSARSKAIPLGPLFSEEEPTYLIFQDRLYYVPLADLHPPELAWPLWTWWRRTYRVLVETHLTQLKKQYGALLSTPLAQGSSSLNPPFSTSIKDRLSPEVQSILLRLFQQQTLKRQPTPSTSQKPSVKREEDIFLKALDALPPLSSLMRLKEGPEDTAISRRSSSRSKKR